MRAKSRTTSTLLRVALIAAAVATSACDAVNKAADKIDDIGNDADVYYYVSLGTSLSVGVQPDSNGIVLPTDDGYADELFDRIRPGFEAAVANRELRLIKLGCPGEDLDKMIDGGSCPYLAGSQLDAAVDFLTDNGDKVHLVTIDMGANDFRDADCIDTAVDPLCINTVSDQISMDLAEVLTTLSNAADPATAIVGMNYYNPYLSSWLDGPAGEVLAGEAALAVAVVNNMLGTTYLTAGMPMADVALAFDSDNFTLVPSSQDPGVLLPTNVNNICDMTYQCDPPPVGPDIHANRSGYSLIADTLEAILP